MVLFIFSKEKTEINCSQEATGTITAISDAGFHHLVIVTDQNTIYNPQSMNNNVVLAAGKKVKICFTTDSAALKPNSSSIPVNIHSVVYIK